MGEAVHVSFSETARRNDRRGCRSWCYHRGQPGSPAVAAEVVAFAKSAGNSNTVNKIGASKTPRAGMLVPLNARGQFPAGVIPASRQAIGQAGPAGLQGATGPAGAIGATGAKGAKGDTGEPGTDRTNGAAGANGADAAIMTFSVDGADAGSVHAYASVIEHNVRATIPGITMAASGMHTLRVRTDAKNAASNNYFGYLVWLRLVKQ